MKQAKLTLLMVRSVPVAPVNVIEPPSAVLPEAIPNAKLYYDFSDFLMYRLTPSECDLNGGFGKAFNLTAADLN